MARSILGPQPFDEGIHIRRGVLPRVMIDVVGGFIFQIVELLHQVHAHDAAQDFLGEHQDRLLVEESLAELVHFFV